MGLATAVSKKKKVSTVMGIDASTHSLAFAIYNDDKLTRYGKIVFSGKTVYDRLADAQDKMIALRSQFDVDYVAIEKAIRVNNAGVALKLAMFVGVIIASVKKDGTEVVEVVPITWQSFIGNRNYTKDQRAKVRRRRINKGKSVSYINSLVRAERKQITMAYFNKKFKINVVDDDVSDAIGVGWYAVNNQ